MQRTASGASPWPRQPARRGCPHYFAPRSRTAPTAITRVCAWRVGANDRLAAIHAAMATRSPDHRQCQADVSCSCTEHPRSCQLTAAGADVPLSPCVQHLGYALVLEALVRDSQECDEDSTCCRNVLLLIQHPRSRLPMHIQCRRYRGCVKRLGISRETASVHSTVTADGPWMQHL